MEVLQLVSQISDLYREGKRSFISSPPCAGAALVARSYYRRHLVPAVRLRWEDRTAFIAPSPAAAAAQGKIRELSSVLYHYTLYNAMCHVSVWQG